MHRGVGAKYLPFGFLRMKDHPIAVKMHLLYLGSPQPKG
ncbi:hypothetical protein Lser_V15G39774 [Lactuca serriola]